MGSRIHPFICFLLFLPLAGLVLAIRPAGDVIKIDLRKEPPAYNREQVLSDYEMNYLGSEVSREELKWTGNTDRCEAGKISMVALKKAKHRINFFRRMAGVYDGIVLDDELNAKCQKAALIILADHDASHRPPKNSTCYSEEGAEACRKSNLSWSSGTNAISSCMNDWGESNFAVGHRRWLLNSEARVFGFGSTSGTVATWVLSSAQAGTMRRENPLPDSLNPDFIAWPPRGFVPSTLVYDRWSFGVPRGKVENAKIEMMYPNGERINLKKLEYVHGYGDPTVVWVPESAFLNNLKVKRNLNEDVSVWVKVSGIEKNDQQYSYLYQVDIISPE